MGISSLPANPLVMLKKYIHRYLLRCTGLPFGQKEIIALDMEYFLFVFLGFKEVNKDT